MIQQVPKQVNYYINFNANILKKQTFTIASHFFLPLYLSASFGGIHLRIQIGKRLASEKVIGLWVGVQSLIIWRFAAVFSLIENSAAFPFLL